MKDVQRSQVASLIQRAVQSILTRGLNDPRVKGLISVTSVEITENGAEATIGVSILPEKDAELAMHGLHHAASHIRYQVGRDVRLRRLPRFIFKYDRTLKKQSEVFAAIETARRRSEGEGEGVVDETDVDQDSINSRSEVPES